MSGRMDSGTAHHCENIENSYCSWFEEYILERRDILTQRKRQKISCYLLQLCKYEGQYKRCLKPQGGTEIYMWNDCSTVKKGLRTVEWLVSFKGYRSDWLLWSDQQHEGAASEGWNKRDQTEIDSECGHSKKRKKILKNQQDLTIKQSLKVEHLKGTLPPFLGVLALSRELKLQNDLF